MKVANFHHSFCHKSEKLSLQRIVVKSVFVTCRYNSIINIQMEKSILRNDNELHHAFGIILSIEIFSEYINRIAGLIYEK